MQTFDVLGIRRKLASKILGAMARCSILALATPSWAAWPTSPTANLPIARATGNQNTSTVVTDGAGGVFVAWTDSRSGARDIYAHRILASGVVDPAWPLDGLAVCTATGDQTNAALVADGFGGCIVVWQDNRNGEPDIFAQRLTSSGTIVVGWPAGGLAVCTAADSQVTPVACRDGEGGVFVTWQDRRSVSRVDIFAHRLLANGTLDAAWPAQGLGICTAIGRKDRPRIIEDSFGGVIITWSDPRAGAGLDDIYASRVLANGTLPSGWPVEGVQLCGAAGAQRFPVLVSDGSGGAIVTWTDERAGSADDDIYAQRVLAGGIVETGWPADGRAVCTATGAQNTPVIVSDDAGGAILAWADGRGANADVYAQRVRADGTMDPAWPSDGRSLCSAIGDQAILAAVQDGSGGALVAWTDFRSGQTNSNIFAQHVNAGGGVDPLWLPDGNALSAASANQATPKAMPDGAGGLIASWTDSRNGLTNTDIYAQRIQGNGLLGGEVVGVPNGSGYSMALGPVTPNPSRGGRLLIHYSLPHAAPARIEVFDITGRRVLLLDSIGERAGPGSLDLEPAQALAPGVFVLRLSQAARNRSTRIVVVR